MVQQLVQTRQQLNDTRDRNVARWRELVEQLEQKAILLADWELKHDRLKQTLTREMALVNRQYDLMRDRKQARAMLREVLFRCDLPETFNEEACAALGEAIDNAHLHGHRHIECCTIGVRMIHARRHALAARSDHPTALPSLAARTDSKNSRSSGSCSVR